MGNAGFNIWAFVIFSGAVQGLFLSASLFIKKQNSNANKWLALLLLAVSLHLLEYGADISGFTLRYPILIAITYPLLFLVGPLSWFYCYLLTNNQFKFTSKKLLHFFPSLLVLLVMLPFYTMPPQEKITYLKGISGANSLAVPVEQLIFMGLHIIQTGIYLLVAYRYLKKLEQELKLISSDVLVVSRLEWLKNFNLFLSVYLLLYILLVILLSVINSYQAQVDYVMLLVTSFSIYAIGYKAMGSPEIFLYVPTLQPKEETKPAALIQTEKDLTAEAQKEKTGLNNPLHTGIKEKLLDCMERTKPYFKSDLKISDLAALISVPAYLLSQVINDEFEVHFYDFINRYRVEEAKNLLVEDDRNFKILSIGYEVGFNSKATFNRVFKKFTGLTPSEYRGKVLTINNTVTNPAP